MQPPDLLSAAQAADTLGVSIKTVHRWAERGTLTPAGKLPGLTGSYLFRRAEVESRAHAEAAALTATAAAMRAKATAA